MHILYVHQHFSTYLGATGTRSYEFAKELVTRGHRVTVVCGAHSLSANDKVLSSGSGIDRLNVVRIPISYSNHLSFWARVKAFVLFALRATVLCVRTRCDLIVASSTPLTVALPGIAVRVLRNKPFVFEVRDLWPTLPVAMGVLRNPLLICGLTLLERIAYTAAAGCVALSDGMRRGILRFDKDPERVCVIPNGCDLNLFTPNSEKGVEEFAIPAHQFVAVYCGAHGAANGLDLLLETAAVLLAANRKDITLLLIGDGKKKHALVEKAREQRLVNCVFHEPLPKQQLARVIPRCHAGLMILQNVEAFYEGTSPNKYFDYLAAGLPVVCNYPGWVAREIEAYRCGVAVEPERPAVLADALIRLADSPEQQVRMGAAAREVGERYYDRQALAAKFAGFLEACAER